MLAGGFDLERRLDGVYTEECFGKVSHGIILIDLSSAAKISEVVERSGCSTD